MDIDRGAEIQNIVDTYKSIHGSYPSHLDFDSMCDESLEECAGLIRNEVHKTQQEAMYNLAMYHDQFISK